MILGFWHLVCVPDLNLERNGPSRTGLGKLGWGVRAGGYWAAREWQPGLQLRLTAMWVVVNGFSW